MPRTREAIVIEADEWRSVAAAVGWLVNILGAISTGVVDASIGAVDATIGGDPLGPVLAYQRGLSNAQTLVLDARKPVDALIALVEARITTLRVELAQLDDELEP